MDSIYLPPDWEHSPKEGLLNNFHKWGHVIKCSRNICGYRLGTLGTPVFEHFRHHPIYKGREENCGNMQEMSWCSEFLRDRRKTPSVLCEGLPGDELLGRRQFVTFWIWWPQSHLIYGPVTAIWCRIKSILRSSFDEPLQLSKACPNYADPGPILWSQLSFILMELVHGEIRDLLGL